MVFGSAKQAEIIRSNQKDEYYMSFIRGSLADIVQTFLGARSWLKWRKEMELAADLGYFALTTLAGYQTLGEEYVNIVQTDPTLRAVPSTSSRVTMILLQVLAPYALDKLLGYWEKELQHNPSLGLTTEGRGRLLQAVKGARHGATLLHRCHLAAFYLRGVYYHVAKRAAGVNYVLVRGDGAESSRPNYRLLGWLSVIQLTFTFLQHGYRLARSGIGKPPSTDAEILAADSSTDVTETPTSSDPSTKCSLCLEPRKSSTITPCGHLFCWECIHQWASNKLECPLCRDGFEVSRLVCLQNFDS